MGLLGFVGNDWDNKSSIYKYLPFVTNALYLLLNFKSLIELDNCSDNELVMRLHSDDVKAFDALYVKYHQALYSNIFKLSKDADATEDILQEVLITLWEKRLTLDPNQPVSNWRFTVSYNKSINYLKKLLKEPVVLKDIIEEAQYAEPNGILGIYCCTKCCGEHSQKSRT